MSVSCYAAAGNAETPAARVTILCRADGRRKPVRWAELVAEPESGRSVAVFEDVPGGDYEVYVI